jgi:hypothetical protein
MTSSELRDKIQGAVRKVYGVSKPGMGGEETFSDELTKFPELSKVLRELLTDDYKVFVESIDWVAPKPTTFRINLKNGQNFYLIYTLRSWIAQVEGKKYYLLNLNEKENATNAISRVLRYGPKATEEIPSEPSDSSSKPKPSSSSSPSPTPPPTPSPTAPETPTTPEEA